MTMASAPGVPTPTVCLVLDEQMLTKEEIYYQVSRLMNAEQCAMTLHHKSPVYTHSELLVL